MTFAPAVLGLLLAASADAFLVQQLQRAPASRARAVTAASAAPPDAVTFTESAKSRFAALREQQALEVLTLRVGVREGGCGDFSYFMDQMKPDEQVDAADTVVQVGDGTRCAIDSKSLRLVAGTRLDYSDDGGFSFSNPNAKSTCGCGNSFDAAG